MSYLSLPFVLEHALKLLLVGFAIAATLWATDALVQRSLDGKKLS